MREKANTDLLHVVRESAKQRNEEDLRAEFGKSYFICKLICW